MNDEVIIKGCEEKTIIKVTINNEIVGVTFWQLINDKLLYFGPFAVSPNHQKKGIGKLMLNELDRIANERNIDELFIKVVNHRLDLIPWYQSLGYIITGTSEWPTDYLHYLTKPTHFIDMIRPLKGNNSLLSSKQNITLSGSCHCKKVQYYVINEPIISCYCHCTICRKISGSLASPWITISLSQLNITSGQESLTSYYSTPQFYRQFCNICGTHLFFHPVHSLKEQDQEVKEQDNNDTTNNLKNDYQLDISFGTIDESYQLKYQPTIHIWYDSKSPIEYNSNLPKYEKEDL